ncbi:MULTISPECIES: cysteine hydrolase family protein [Achromobacter]|uniref:Cysteine hydrolase n=1 Tax=Achromobacter denitrificans TaxID=32002 RepID=A0A6J5I7R9_ACHDE|nr:MULTISPECIES: isochorismatase family cysteine hydrolase [Achromobacter]MBV2159323.1 cysteine hydrolase [Achromobacter denitrificans]MDF3859832.1 cysteine hydrolase [Achromobacter denitrificans]QKQ51304.1 cysteine hydrolase [Achromobacter denitrificans]CAB3901118.1 Peroxyureidoacrylate/ureidoacrylate amidohydrolase RutB [Achromobacter denitrificans]GFN25847.1 peroxyureidoacrylate/ureidoacrylate amidohydrolase RutB [Achromobacter denitrificans]
MPTLDPRSTALIVVDLQNDFLAPGGAYDRGGAVSPQARALPARVAPVARALKARGGFVAASQFTLWPDAHGEPMISPHLRQLRPFLRKGDFAAGSAGQANVAELDGLVDVSVWKVAYSAFFNTQLDWVLRRAGIANVVIAGIVTNGGVASTARDAHMRDYHVSVLADGCAAPTPAMHDAALADLRTVADVLSCQDFLEALGA